jgi:hypothetical protein
LSLQVLQKVSARLYGGNERKSIDVFAKWMSTFSASQFVGQLSVHDASFYADKGSSHKLLAQASTTFVVSTKEINDWQLWQLLLSRKADWWISV